MLAIRRERLAPLLAPGRIVVTQGFIGSEASGRMTLLGRGGSDYSASLFGAALGASRIEIWTDVDGVLTANPRIVPSARRVRLMSFDEASELAYFGAKVLHPATLLPAIETSIPVKVLNARRPEGDGTTIVSRGVAPPDDRFVVKAIADKRRIVLVNVVSTRMLMAHGFLARIFRVFDEHRTPVDLLATSEVSVSLTIDDDRRLDAIVEALSEFAKVEVERGLAVVCLVGEGMRGRASIAAEVFRAIRSSRVRLITQGASAINLSVVLPEEEVDAALRQLHEAFFRGSLPAEIFGESFEELEDRPAAGASERSVPGPLGGPALAELAGRHGTPLYVYDLDAIAERALRVMAYLPREVSIADLLLDHPLQKRFASDPQCLATLMLLHERIPKVAPFLAHPAVSPLTHAAAESAVPQVRVINRPDTPVPEVQLLSNGRYHVLVTAAGGGYSRWNDMAVTRWQDDPTRDHWGSFCYIRDMATGTFWSNTAQPASKRPDHYEAVFTEGRAEFHRQDRVDDSLIETRTEIVVSAGVSANATS